jgi:cytochrome c-type biogenesis protein CcmH/NrfG
MLTTTATVTAAACAAKPGEAIAWLGLGESLHALHDHTAALEACQTAAQLSPLR